MKPQLCLVLAISAIPVAVQAQQITGGLTLSYSSFEDDAAGIEQDGRGLDGRMDIDFENGFTFGIDGGLIDLSQEGVPFDISGEFIGLEGGYRFENGVKVGGFAEQLTVGAGVFPIDFTLKTYGITAGYEMSGIDLELFAGRSSTSPDIGADVDNYGLIASYDGIAGLNLGASLLRADLDAGGGSAEIDFRGVAATYAINEAFIAFGGISNSSIDLFGTDFDSMGIGVGYDLAAVAGVSSTVSLELARTEQTDGAGSADLDTVRLGVTFPLGTKGPALPMNSVADAILNPRHGALNSILTATY